MGVSLLFLAIFCIRCKPTKTHLAQNELHVAELTVLPQPSVVLVKGALWVAGKLRRQSSKKQCRVVSSWSAFEKPEAAFWRSPEICTSPRCARCCPRSLQRCTWHPGSRRQHGIVSRSASEEEAQRDAGFILMLGGNDIDFDIKYFIMKLFRCRRSQ